MSENHSPPVQAVLKLVENRCAFLRDMIKDVAERMQLAKTSPNWLRGQWEYQREKNTKELAHVTSGITEIEVALARCKQQGRAISWRGELVRGLRGLLQDVDGDFAAAGSVVRGILHNIDKEEP